MKEAIKKTATTKRKTAAKPVSSKKPVRRGRPPKSRVVEKNNTDVFYMELFGLLFIGLGLFSAVALFMMGAGILGTTIKTAIFTIFGLTGYLFPFFFVLIGLSMILRRPRLFSNKRTYGILLGIATTAMLLSLNRMEQVHTDGLFTTMKNLMNLSDNNHGGILGLLFATPFYRLIGPVGTYILSGSLYILSVVLMLNTTVYDSLKKGNDVRLATKERVLSRNLLKPGSAKPVRASVSEKDAESRKIEDKLKILEIMNKGSDQEVIADETVKTAPGVRTAGGTKSPFICIDLDLPPEAVTAGVPVKAETHSPYDDIPDEIPISIHDSQERSEVPGAKSLKPKPVVVDEADLTPLKGEQMDINIDEVGFKEIKHKPQYRYPEIALLKENIKGMLDKEDRADIIENAKKLEDTLMSFGVEARVINVSKGPSVTRYELQPKAGVKVSRIVSLSDDIALGLAANGVRIEAPIPGKAAVGIEIPNKETTPVYLREVIESKEFQKSSKRITVAFGKDISGDSIIGDLTKMPHVLIAGATGSGKSVCINSLIISILYKYTPDEVRLLMVDPKVVELNVYNGIPHLLIPVVTDPKKAAGALNWAVNEMTRRYQFFADLGVRNIESYNEMAKKKKDMEKLPYIVIIVDELADLMMVSANEVEDYIARLAQMARAAGMHLVIATQRPSVDVITGVIKANIPSRISFAVSSSIDSRTILDSGGAEKLLGKGDMLYYPVGEQKPKRVQGAFISEEEVEAIVARIKVPLEELSYDETILNHIESSREDTDTSEDGDDLIEEAVKIVVEHQQASTSFLQRKMRIGYNRAARIMDQLEERGVISGRDGAKPRQVLLKSGDL